MPPPQLRQEGRGPRESVSPSKPASRATTPPPGTNALLPRNGASSTHAKEIRTAPSSSPGRSSRPEATAKAGRSTLRNVSPRPGPESRRTKTAASSPVQVVTGDGPAASSSVAKGRVAISRDDPAFKIGLPESITRKLSTLSDDELHAMRQAPKEGLVCEHVYGYDGSRQRNLFDLGKGACLYSVAALAVVHKEDNRQVFFDAHTAEVIALAYCAATQFAASGQNVDPRTGAAKVCIWGVDDACEILEIRLRPDMLVDALCFAADGAFVFAALSGPSGTGIGSSTKRSIANSSSSSDGAVVYGWLLGNANRIVEKPQFKISVGQSMRGLVPHPSSAEHLLMYSSDVAGTVLQQWNSLKPGATVAMLPLHPGSIERVRRSCGLDRGEFCSGCFISAAVWHRHQRDLVALGSTEGDVYIFEGDKCIRGLSAVSGSPILFVHQTSHELVCGGPDGGLTFFSQDLGGPSRPRVPLYAPGTRVLLQINDCVDAAAHKGSEEFLIGTQGGEIVRVTVPDIAGGEPEMKYVQQSLAISVSAVAVHPSAVHVAFGGVEGHVQVVDLQLRTPLGLSPHRCKAGVRCLVWSPGAEEVQPLLVCGLGTGELELLSVIFASGSGGSRRSATLSSLLTIRVAPKAAEDASPVTDVVFSLDVEESRWQLACGCMDGSVFIFSLEHSPAVGVRLQRQRALTSAEAGVLALQFVRGGRQLLANTSDGQLHCWDSEKGCHVAPGDENWFEDGHPFRLSMAWPTAGVWMSPPVDLTLGLSAGDLVARSDFSARLLAVGGIEQGVRLYQFPASLEGCEASAYGGHCSKVLQLAWAQGRLFSAGSSTQDCVLQWRLTSTPPITASSAARGAAFKVAKVPDVAAKLASKQKRASSQPQSPPQKRGAPQKGVTRSTQTGIVQKDGFAQTDCEDFSQKDVSPVIQFGREEKWQSLAPAARDGRDFGCQASLEEIYDSWTQDNELTDGQDDELNGCQDNWPSSEGNAVPSQRSYAESWNSFGNDTNEVPVSSRIARAPLAVVPSRENAFDDEESVMSRVAQAEELLRGAAVALGWSPLQSIKSSELEDKFDLAARIQNSLEEASKTLNSMEEEARANGVVSQSTIGEPSTIVKFSSPRTNAVFSSSSSSPRRQFVQVSSSPSFTAAFSPSQQGSHGMANHTPADSSCPPTPAFSFSHVCGDGGSSSRAISPNGPDEASGDSSSRALGHRSLGSVRTLVTPPVGSCEVSKVAAPPQMQSSRSQMLSSRSRSASPVAQPVLGPISHLERGRTYLVGGATSSPGTRSVSGGSTASVKSSPSRTAADARCTAVDRRQVPSYAYNSRQTMRTGAPPPRVGGQMSNSNVVGGQMSNSLRPSPVIVQRTRHSSPGSISVPSPSTWTSRSAVPQNRAAQPAAQECMRRTVNRALASSPECSKSIHVKPANEVTAPSTSRQRSSPSLSNEVPGGLPEPQMLLRVFDVASHKVLAQAAVFLYHPPFALHKAVDYACLPDPLELFTAPPGWGILRSKHGLLLWLQLHEDSPLVAISAGGTGSFPLLQLIFESPDRTEELSVSAEIAGLADGAVPLQEDSGILRPASAPGDRLILRLRLDPGFDRAAKDWLSRTPCTTLQSS